MSEYPGQGSNGKIIKYNLRSYEGDLNLYELDRRDTAALIASIIPLDWMKRHDSLPTDLDTQDKLSAFADRLRLRLMTIMNFCERMIQCITSDADVQSALVDWLIQALAENELLQQAVTNANYYNNGQGLPSKPDTSGNILIPADCIKDNAAGYVKTGIVDRAFDNIGQAFDVMILATTDELKKAAFFDFIPAIGELADFIAYQDIITFSGNFIGWMKTNFEAEDSPSLRTKYYRDLLCLYINNGCSLSMEDIRDYFWKEATRVNSGFNDAIGTAIDFYNYVINGTASSFDGIVPVLMAIQFGGAYFVQSLFGIPLQLFKAYAVLGEPTDDWIAWEAEHGVCECFDTYTPDNVGIYEVETGIIGIEGVFASSEIIGGGSARHQITVVFDDLQVTDALAIEFITNRPIIDGASGVEFTVAGNQDSPLNATDSYYVAPDRWGIRIDFASPITDGIEDILIRQNIGDVTNDFSFVEFRIYYAC